MIYQVNLDTLVPKDNYYRLIGKEIDFGFLYNATKQYYGTEGQESIDPEEIKQKAAAGEQPVFDTVRKLIAGLESED